MIQDLTENELEYLLNTIHCDMNNSEVLEDKQFINDIIQKIETELEFRNPGYYGK